MKKKLFAAFAAAAMLCCTLATPVSAAETYKLGDINMDGEVDWIDARMALQEFVTVYVAKNPEGDLTQEQLALAMIFPPDALPEGWIKYDSEYAYLMQYAMIIFQYSVECIAHPEYAEMEIAESYQYWR